MVSLSWQVYMFKEYSAIILIYVVLYFVLPFDVIFTIYLKSWLFDHLEFDLLASLICQTQKIIINKTKNNCKTIILDVQQICWYWTIHSGIFEYHRFTDEHILYKNKNANFILPFKAIESQDMKIDKA
jgi:hypothetical protein